MKVSSCLLFLGIMLVISASAQDVSLDLQKPHRVAPDVKMEAWKALPGLTGVGFGSSDKRYSQDIAPGLYQQQDSLFRKQGYCRADLKPQDTLYAWRGEKVHTQLVVWTKSDIKRVRVKTGSLKSQKGKLISPDNVQAAFVAYTTTDEFRAGCGHRKPIDFDSSLVADIIDNQLQYAVMDANTVQPVWISIQVPQSTPPGDYTTIITVKADKEYSLPLVVRVADRQLPPPSEWHFALDLWQHPAAIARVHQTQLWSKEHYKRMKPYYTMLAAAGQKNITVSIVEEPWGHQTYDDYPALIKWTRHTDGNWSFDYSLFDQYVEFVMSCGIDQRINCYSMVPWKIAFPYFDEEKGQMQTFNGKIGSPEYNAFWTPMLRDFTRHLKQKGWFTMTAIAMDERPMAAMQAVIGILKTIDSDWKIALAGDYHPEIENDIFDYCIASRFLFPAEVLQDRVEKGKLSTWYTCCAEKYPNGFTFSPPAEHVWIGWYTAAHNMDGYLRWAYNSWPANPLTDSRFTAWPAGDTFQVYPGPRSSIRFEKLIEGIQDYEKIRILQQQAMLNNDRLMLEKIKHVLGAFQLQVLAKQTAEEMVIRAKRNLFE